MYAHISDTAFSETLCHDVMKTTLSWRADLFLSAYPTSGKVTVGCLWCRSKLTEVGMWNFDTDI